MSHILQESVNFANRELTIISQELEQFNIYQDFWRKVVYFREEYDPNNPEIISRQERLNPETDPYVLYFALILIRKELDKIADYPKYRINTNLTTNNTNFDNN